MLRRVIITFFMVALMDLAVTGPAKADGTCASGPQELNFTYTSGMGTYAWSLPAMPTGPNCPVTAVASIGVVEFEPTTPDSFTFSLNGGPQMSAILDFITNPNSAFTLPGGFQLTSPDGSVLLLYATGAQIFGGTLDAPTFSAEIGLTLEDNTLNNNPVSGMGTLDITPASASAVPEPGSLVLIGTGLLALFGIARKRLLS